MPGWDRWTPWRQGNVLTSDTVATLHLCSDEDASRCLVVVISHDCDLAQDPSIEPIVEVISGRRVPAPSGNFTHGKNPRRLHLSAIEHGTTIWIELTAVARLPLPKQELVGHNPSSSIMIDAENRNTLQHWLAARYRRSAFPDQFDRYLIETGIGARMAKILQPLGTHIVAVFFDVDEGYEREHESVDDPFSLAIDLLYSTDTDANAAEAEARSAAEAITGAFQDRCLDKPTNKWRWIELLACTPISDEALTYALSRRLKRWNADYISLRSQPLQPMVLD
jgi:hypothetical protein